MVLLEGLVARKVSLGIIGEIDKQGAIFRFFSLSQQSHLTSLTFSIFHPQRTLSRTSTHFSINFVHCLRDDDDLLCTVFLFPSLNSQYIHVGVLSGKIVHA